MTLVIKMANAFKPRLLPVMLFFRFDPMGNYRNLRWYSQKARVGYAETC